MSEKIVYFIGNEKGTHVKIGSTLSLERRIKELQTGTHEKLTVLGFMRGDEVTEKAIHSAFRHMRVPGTEWFHQTGTLKTFIDGMSEASAQDVWRLEAPKPNPPKRITVYIPTNLNDAVRQLGLQCEMSLSCLVSALLTDHIAALWNSGFSSDDVRKKAEDNSDADQDILNQLAAGARLGQWEEAG